MLDSLYGNLLGSTAPASKPAGMDGVSTTGPVAAHASQPGKQHADDIFAQPKEAAPVKEPKPEVSTAPLPQAFSAAKLMMPPVRRKAEPISKRPVVPSLDIHKLQEEKEALMRQRAAAERKDDRVLGALGSLGSLGAGVATAPGASSLEGVPEDTSPSAGALASLYGSPDEEYDPAKPNDYDEFCRRRMRQKAEEEMERRRQDTLARQAKAPEVKEDDFATRMMKKMGWKGEGLGKDGQGITTPLVMKKTDRAVGAIVEGTKRETPTPNPLGQPEAKQAKTSTSIDRPPTRVLLLNNLVGAGEVDEDLEGETAEEAGKYGKLKRCVIREIKNVPEDQAVRIFLEYERPEDAMKALVDMNGRYFGGRVVRARFYDEQRFESGDLENRHAD